MPLPRVARRLLPATVAALGLALLVVPVARAATEQPAPAGRPVVPAVTLTDGPVAGVRVGPAPCTVPAPTTPEGWQQAFDDLNDDRWSGGDQGSSLRLPDGRLLWVFADSFQGAQRADGSRAAGSRLVHNSLVVADGGCLTGVTGPDGGEVVPNAADGEFHWPQHAFLDGGRLYLSVFRVRGTAVPGSTDFTTTGTHLASFDLVPGGSPVFTGLTPTPSAGTSDDVVQWGTAVAQDDGATYVYGTRRVEDRTLFGKALYVARVPAGAVTDLAAWRFWDGAGWATDAGAATPVKDARGGVSTALSIWRAADGTWHGVTKKDEYLGDQVVALRAPSATGPWTEQVIGSSPSYAVPGELTYTALAHPDVPLDGGGLLVSVSRNNESWTTHLADGDLYKPQFSRAPAA
ncbi:DUF4185 domain-containing protein [Modestobacter sp. I12A-02628]|uniref:DUF4185 domain-containing protein n=1 Tax=Goekera deserti TaxID=2497753 RepID=A0A7K3WII1_9ACTN|nr:DUF4185 domain-containing protein [Goekera deserti]MPR00377.1 DUF4185 domain-containing protein [Goekera deserti]NDI50420.1 DUF4185 domain-containing protein [Goekera deserti]NEL55313.1 DUF4185 domain-containing protein [Goekera deserti]